jgi:hypothetical protein
MRTDPKITAYLGSTTVCVEDLIIMVVPSAMYSTTIISPKMRATSEATASLSTSMFLFKLLAQFESDREHEPHEYRLAILLAWLP